MSDMTAGQRVLVEWQDPRPRWAAARSMTGPECLGALVDGTMPTAPIGALMDFSGASVDEGRVVFRGQPGERHLNQIVSVHGGFAATLLDPAAGPVVCEATLGHRGKRLATAIGRVTREHDGRLPAQGATTCVLLPLSMPAASDAEPH